MGVCVPCSSDGAGFFVCLYVCMYGCVCVSHAIVRGPETVGGERCGGGGGEHGRRKRGKGRSVKDKGKKVKEKQAGKRGGRGVVRIEGGWGWARHRFFPISYWRRESISRVVGGCVPLFSLSLLQERSRDVQVSSARSHRIVCVFCCFFCVFFFGCLFRFGLLFSWVLVFCVFAVFGGGG